MLPCTSTQCWVEWNVIMYFHSALGACAPLKEVPISHALPSSNCPGLRVLQKFNKQRDLFSRPGISTKSDRSRVWWLSEGKGEPALHWKRTPFWKSHAPLETKCTVLVIQLVLTNCVQAHDNCLEVLRHINLYLSTRQPQTIGFLSHAGIFWNSVFPRIPSFKTNYFFQKSTEKSSKKNSLGCAPHPLLTGLRQGDGS